MLTPKITDYQILKYSQSSHLENEIAEAIKEGWQPLGGVSVCLYASTSDYKSDKVYHQAIVKYEKQKTNSI